MDSAPDRSTVPDRRLRARHAIAIVVGTVVGAGIFRSPASVAAAVDSTGGFLALWALGGLVSLAGALCYAELACAYPSAGGEYTYLTRAWGRTVGVLFAWARVAVITTGSIALLAFVLADYATAVLPLGSRSDLLYAAACVVLLTATNLVGLRVSATLQSGLTGFVVLGLFGVAALGLGFDGQADASPPPASAPIGLAMVFVLLTYGGWNEAAYLSAEVRGGPRRMVAVLGFGVGAVTLLYLLVNAAYARVLGVAGVRASEAVGADALEALLGSGGALSVSILVAATVVTSINATIVTGARSTFALGRDLQVLRRLGTWDARRSVPRVAVVVQGAVALALIGVGASSRRGFETMVAYTAPVFWGFFLLVGLALFVLRVREPHVQRPFRVPLYPLTPLVFCASCAWLLVSSIRHSGAGAAFGLLVLAIGLVPLAVERAHAARQRRAPTSAVGARPAAAAAPFS